MDPSLNLTKDMPASTALLGEHITLYLLLEHIPSYRFPMALEKATFQGQWKEPKTVSAKHVYPGYFTGNPCKKPSLAQEAPPVQPLLPAADVHCGEIFLLARTRLRGDWKAILLHIRRIS